MESRPCANYAAVVKENNDRSRLRAEVIIYLVISFLHSRNFTQMFVLKILSGHNLVSQALYLHFPPEHAPAKQSKVKSLDCEFGVVTRGHVYIRKGVIVLAFYGQTIYLLIISDSDHFPESLEKQQDSSSIEKRYIIVEYLHMETGVYH